MAKKKEKRLVKDTVNIRGNAPRIGDPAGWSRRALVEAYAEAARDGLFEQTKQYADILRAKGEAVPKIRSPDGQLYLGWYSGKFWRPSQYTTGSSFECDLLDGKLVRVFDPAKKDSPDGDVLSDFQVLGYSVDWKDLEKKFGPSYTIEQDGQKFSVIEVPVNEAVISTATMSTGKQKRPLMCVYDAVKTYCRDLLGVTLSTEDEEFFIKHPLVSEDGVPFPSTLRVVQELIDPYGLRISRVVIQKNYNVKGDIMQWRSMLGINPLALADRSTSNADFSVQMNNKVDTSGFRFEYDNTPLFPAVACGIVGGANTGWTGGHAAFIPPRRRVTGALMTFQIARAEHVHWKKQPVFAEIQPSVHTPVSIEVFDLQAWWGDWKKDKDTSSTWNPSFKNAKAGGNGKVSTDPAMLSQMLSQAIQSPPIEDFKEGTCYSCNRADRQRSHILGVPGVCDLCWLSLAAQITCPKCDKKSAKHQIEPVPSISNPFFEYSGYDLKKKCIWVRCTQCQKEYYTTSQTHGAWHGHVFDALSNYKGDKELYALYVRTQPASFSPPAPSNAAPSEVGNGEAEAEINDPPIH